MQEKIQIRMAFTQPLDYVEGGRRGARKETKVNIVFIDVMILLHLVFHVKIMPWIVHMP
jgi:hypothetical protein